MSFEVPAESMPLPPVFNADNLAYSHPFPWGTWNVTEQAHAAYGLVPAVQPQEAAAVGSDGYTPISVALLGPEEITSLLPQPGDAATYSFQLGASSNLENPWIAVGSTSDLDLGHEYMDALLADSTEEDLVQAWQRGKFMMEQFIMRGAGHLTMQVAAKEAVQARAQADRRSWRGAAQMLAGSTAFIADVASTVSIPDKPYITLPLGAITLGTAVFGARRAAQGTQDGKRVMDGIVHASAIAAARGLGVANNIHNVYAPTRKD